MCSVHIGPRQPKTTEHQQVPNTPAIRKLFLLYLSSAVRSLALDGNSKLSIRMVAEFAELIEGKRFFGCEWDDKSSPSCNCGWQGRVVDFVEAEDFEQGE